jgi:hypothetical protein
MTAARVLAVLCPVHDAIAILPIGNSAAIRAGIAPRESQRAIDSWEFGT